MRAFRWLVAAALAAALVLPAAAEQSPLVDANWLSKNLNDPKVRVFEVSVEPGVYERGHIPGAVNIRWQADLVETVRRDTGSRDKFKALVEGAGVTKDFTIVLYSDHSNLYAAWAAWVFEIYGLGAQVKLLDGGRKIWEDRGLPLENREPAYAKSTIDLPEPNLRLRARLNDLSGVVDGRDKGLIVDIRTADEYAGMVAANFNGVELRAGHVPGAKNVPWASMVAADGAFKPKHELAKLYAAVGVNGTQPVIVYCRLGERSSYAWFVLAKILGYEARNFDGAWIEYGKTGGLPIADFAGIVSPGK